MENTLVEFLTLDGYDTDTIVTRWVTQFGALIGLMENGRIQ